MSQRDNVLRVLSATLRRKHPKKWKETMVIEFRMRRKRALRSVLLSGYKAALLTHCPPLATELKSAELKSADTAAARTEL